MPWLTNVAPPKGLPMQPTIDILPVNRVCQYCASEKGKGKTGECAERSEDGEGEVTNEDEDEDMGEGDEDEDMDMDAEGESISEDELRAMIGDGYSLDRYGVLSGFGGSLGARVGASAGSASAGGVRSSLVPVAEEDAEDEDDEEGGAGIS